MAFSFDVLRECSPTIQLYARVGAKHERGIPSDSELQARTRRQQMVLVIAEAAFSFHGQKEIPIPFMLGFESRISAEQIKWNRFIVSRDLYSVLGGRNLHLPVSGMGAGMKVAIANKLFYREVNRPTSSEQQILNVSGVLAMAHPDTLFE